MVDTEEHISEEAIRSSATREVSAGTVLVVVKSKVLARRLPVAVTTRRTCFSQDVKGIVPTSHVPARYLAAHLKIAEPMLLAQARGLNTEGLTLSHLRDHLLMLPPKSLLARYTALDTSIRRARSRSASAADTSSGLVEALTQRAFRGEL